MSTPMPWPQPGYCTREDVRAALDVQETPRSDAQLDRLIDGARESIEGLLSRRLWPLRATRTFDWPNQQQPKAWRLWLDFWELISVEQIVNAGVALDPFGYFLRPDWGPPYNLVELNLAHSDAFGGGPTYQRVVSITGVFGRDDNRVAAGQAAAALTDTTGTSLPITNSAAIGVGSLVTIDSEKLIVTEKTYADTGVTLGADLAASNAAKGVVVADGTKFFPGEVLIIDSESVRIDKIAGNTLVVSRAFDGSALTTHTAGTHLYAPRTCTVVRGAAGTVPATHNINAPLSVWPVPGLIRQLSVAEVIVALTAESTGYASRQVGMGLSSKISFDKLTDLRERAVMAFGRKIRTRMV